jgi:hypothetical protein
MAAKVRPALLLTGNPADDELDLVTVLRTQRLYVTIAGNFPFPSRF